VRKIESREILATGEFGLLGPPVESTGDHQVNHEPEISFDPNGDPLADASQLPDGSAFDGGDAGFRSPKYKRAGEPDPLDGLAEDSGFKCANIRDDIRQFGHALYLEGSATAR
jgi:hypothetical protein